MTVFADLSHHQDPVDLAAYKAAGHDRIILKASEGTSFTDSAFVARWREAGQLGLARVAYHYARAKYDGADEFDHHWSVMQAAGGLGARDRLCLDVEDTETPNRAAANAREFTARAVANGISWGLVYTGRWYANPNRVTAGIFPPGWRRLWLSHYDTSVPDSEILLPDGWSRDQLVARQYTYQARVSGIADLCDYSRLLREWLTTVPAPTPQEDWMTTPISNDNLDAIAAAVNDKLRETLTYNLSPRTVGRALTALLERSSTEINAVAAVRAAVDAVRADQAVSGDREEKALALLAEIEAGLPEPAPEPAA